MAKVIMVQGTTSNAGKSILCAALCRIFAQDGYSVAPFKSQNMALNSFITEDGYEMGRAQVVQAEAAYKKPDVRMNPILLKPTSDKGSQVIVRGEVAGDMDAMTYYKNKRQFLGAVLEDFNSLAQENDIIVIEGAGSPAEINLRENDIVNMGLAEMVDAPVLLVGDIDRGGVFASLYGTHELLTPDERKRIVGLVINKFRGDAAILQPGIDMLYERLPVPVVGVIPYMSLRIDDEDSLSSVWDGGGGALDIAVVRLPKISNFTDFSAFDILGGMKVRYIETAEQVKEPDLLILPGTKNTIADMRFLHESGIATKIKRFADTGGAVFGVCGGYQMLTERIEDPHGVEGGGSIEGLGLLPATTVFETQKTRTRVSGKIQGAKGVFACMNGHELSGYEIHMGTTATDAPLCVLTQENGTETLDGLSFNNVAGSYVHGIFDSAPLLHALLHELAKRKGIEYSADKSIDMESVKQSEYDKLADTVRASLDMKAIYEIINKKTGE